MARRRIGFTRDRERVVGVNDEREDVDHAEETEQPMAKGETQIENENAQLFIVRMFTTMRSERDSSGELLQRRGTGRKRKAPLREPSAAMLIASGWEKATALDPMGGGGHPVEAASCPWYGPACTEFSHELADVR